MANHTRPAVSFPANFLWGAATAAYQIEGAYDTDGRGMSVWDTFSHTPGKVLNGDTGDVACDHYHLMQPDVTMMRDLGLQAYRFSISWPRVLPEGKGSINTKGLDFYQRLVEQLLDHGITPVPTLFHWDLPQALEDLGGFHTRDVAGWFGDYAATMVDALGDRVIQWSTLNEPWVYTYLGHAAGIFAPGIANDHTAVTVAHYQMLAHGTAIEAMRSVRSDLDLGVVLNPTNIYSEGSPAVPDETIDVMDAIHNRWWLDAMLKGSYPDALMNGAFGELADAVQDGDLATISQRLDWLGVNYYADSYVRIATDDTGPAMTMYPTVTDVAQGAVQPNHTDMDWPITPDGLHKLLVRLKRDYDNLPPVYITENGCAYDYPVQEINGVPAVQDVRRIDYLDQYLRALHAAMDDGVDVRGYFQWSLLDNFEWASGYSKRFGCVHVDYDTLERTVKDSGYWYSDVIARQGLAEYGD